MWSLHKAPLTRQQMCIKCLDTQHIKGSPYQGYINICIQYMYDEKKSYSNEH